MCRRSAGAAAPVAVDGGEAAKALPCTVPPSFPPLGPAVLFAPFGPPPGIAGSRGSTVADKTGVPPAPAEDALALSAAGAAPVTFARDVQLERPDVGVLPKRVVWRPIAPSKWATSRGVVTALSALSELWRIPSERI